MANPYVANVQRLIDALRQRPEVQAALASGQPQEFKVGNVKVRTENGHMSVETGVGWTKPLLLAGATLATAGLAAGAFPAITAGLGAAGSGATGAGYIGADVAGTAAAAGGGTAAATGGGILGALGKYGQMAGDIGQVATGIGAGAAAGRRQEDQTQLQAANLNLNAPTTRAQQVAKGDLMSADIPQSQRIGSGRDVSFTGGIGPQSFGPDTAAAGDQLKKQALAKLMSGQPEYTPAAPGLGENLASGIGIGGSILGALSRYGYRKGY